MHELHSDPSRSRGRPHAHKDNYYKEHFDQEEASNIQELKTENHKYC